VKAPERPVKGEPWVRRRDRYIVDIDAVTSPGRFQCEACSFSCPAEAVNVEYVCPHCGHDHSDDGCLRSKASAKKVSP